MITSQIPILTLMNVGNGNSNIESSTNLYGYAALNTNWYWYTGAYGPAGVAGQNIEFSWLHGPGASYFAGLTSSGAPNSRGTIEFALHPGTWNGHWWVYEYGARIVDLLVYGNGDRAAVRVGQDGVVKYYINNVLKYTSGVAAATVQALALRPGVCGGYYASWDENYETQPSSQGTSEIKQALLSTMEALSTGPAVPTTGLLWPRR